MGIKIREVYQGLRIVGIVIKYLAVILFRGNFILPESGGIGQGVKDLHIRRQPASELLQIEHRFVNHCPVIGVDRFHKCFGGFVILPGIKIQNAQIEENNLFIRRQTG